MAMLRLRGTLVGCAAAAASAALRYDAKMSTQNPGSPAKDA